MTFVRIYGLLLSLSLAMAAVWASVGLPATTPQGFGIRFYQAVAGPVDGRRCPSYPVCSLYARQALERYGLLVGSWMMLDRLIHEFDDVHRGPWILVHGRVRLNDTLERNTAWVGREE